MHTIRRPHNPQSGITQQESLEQFIVPLELKTGKMSHTLGSVDHRAQVNPHTLPCNSVLAMCMYRSCCIRWYCLSIMKGKPLGVSCITSRPVTWWVYLLLITRSEVGVIKLNNMFTLPYTVSALVMMRNRLASYLDNCYANKLPEMLRYAHTCQYCPLLQSCCMFHKWVLSCGTHYKTPSDFNIQLCIPCLCVKLCKVLIIC